MVQCHCGTRLAEIEPVCARGGAGFGEGEVGVFVLLLLFLRMVLALGLLLRLVLLPLLGLSVCVGLVGHGRVWVER